MKQIPSDEYLEKAKLLSRDDAEKILARMRPKLMRRMEDNNTSPLEAVALQLQKDDADLAEWRARWAEITARDEAKRAKRK